MKITSDNYQWGGIAQTLHWIMAITIIVLGIVGLIMGEMPNTPAKIQVYNLHKSAGLTVLALALLRLAWRIFDQRPLDSPTMPCWQKWAARGVHVALYLLMLALPLSGWLFNSAKDFPLRWFGLISIPSLTSGQNSALARLAHEVHETLFWVLIGILVLHVGAALKHHFYDRDNVLKRMLP